MSIQPNYPLFDPAYSDSVTGDPYQNPTNTVYTPPVLGTGNPDPVYDPQFAEYAEGTPYAQPAPQGPPVVPYDSPAANRAKTGNAYQAQGTVYNQPPAQPSAQPTGVYGPAFFSKNLNQSYQAAGQQFNQNPPDSHTGNPDPLYGPGFFTQMMNKAYQPNGYVNDSQVGPTIVFQVNLLNPLFPGGDLPPNRTSLDGNETVSEAQNQLATRQVWFPDMVVNENGSTGGSPAVEGIGGIFAGQNGNGQNGASYNHPQGYLHHGSQFTVKGQRAMYLKSLFVSSPASPADLLIVVSQS